MQEVPANNYSYVLDVEVDDRWYIFGMRKHQSFLSKKKRKHQSQECIRKVVGAEASDSSWSYIEEDMRKAGPKTQRSLARSARGWLGSARSLAITSQLEPAREPLAS